jgi:Putative salt-induced outer membrane protein
MSIKPLLAGVTLLFVLTGAAYADSYWVQIEANADAARKVATKPGWQGSMSLGYLATTGNTNTRSLNGHALAGYKSGKWQDALSFQGINASQNGVTTAQSYELNGQSDYNFTDRDYVFGMADYLRDTFSGYRRRTSEILGYGRRLLSTATQQLDVEIGGGARQTHYTNATDSSEFVERLAASYLWKFSGKSNFSENIGDEHGTNNTFIQSITALTTNLAGNFALSVSYTVRYNSNVLPGFKNTDTITSISLVYTF